MKQGKGLVAFRIHFADGTTVNVTAPNAAIARGDAKRDHPGVAITKVKVLKGEEV
ncbi:hypothetical protein GRZ55_11380 [Chelativorans sp. ZYF759]|uniref:hypothetical protein n=1 Tax=Chelativorans sp. ZYF759 TaxID=2692213 RepID=UPI00145ED6E9|nr:hypothetical protein [Chelativorans sp. ZYF759]NMG39846.1 hypothetical protein [Chelativorans sp. ZYF759]